MFEHVISQQDITTRLHAAHAQDRLAHAYLFYGSEGVGKRAVAWEMARQLLCREPGEEPCGQCGDCVKVARMDHPDLLWLLPTRTGGTEKQKLEDLQQTRAAVAEDLYSPPAYSGNRLIAINQVRELQNRAAMRAFQGGWRIFVIQEVDLLNVQSANALLKLLEEPPPSVLLLLTANDYDKLLPTIISRCVGIRFPGLAAEELIGALRDRHDISEDEARVVADLSDGSITEALRQLDAGMAEKLEIATALLTGTLAPRNVPLPLDIVEDLAQPGKAHLFRDVLRIMLFWMRRIYQADVAQADVAGVPPVILQSMQNSEFTTLRAFINEVEKSIDLIDRNVYIFLIGSVLLTHLRDLYQVRR
jgi:DNA polymerase III subunit delta'